MLDILKDHGPAIIQSAVDTKTAAAGAISAVGVLTVAVTEPEKVTLAIDEWSVIAVIFSCTATGLCMISAFILNLIKIRKGLKSDKDE